MINPVVVCAILLVMMIASSTANAGLFGPPQTVSREAGGLNTAIGYLLS